MFQILILRCALHESNIFVQCYKYMEKHVLFYSNFCAYSKEILSDITKKNIRDRFVIVCIDQRRETLPPYVDRVPMIVTNKKELVYDDVMTPFIETLYNESGSKEIMPFTGSSLKTMFSDGFSSLDDDNSGIEASFAKGYVYIGDADRIKITTPKDDDVSNSKLDQKQIEAYVSQRDRDIQQTLVMFPRPI